MTSCASKVHRASGPGRGSKPVLICILACSLAITFKRSGYTKITFLKLSQRSDEPVGIAVLLSRCT